MEFASFKCDEALGMEKTTAGIVVDIEASGHKKTGDAEISGFGLRVRLNGD
ncbi:hypothetical protein Rhal01_03235 [Rubritalea halochordaticola]|uniref:Uncharacterized protein n=1 Tax=Rubritalea halochordaticola TaxID=714537 RepID=A0ABP9V8W4_9BACT